MGESPTRKDVIITAKERAMLPVDEMAEALEASKNRNGYTKKLYKAEADEHKAEQLREDIANRVEALKRSTDRKKIDFNDFAMVQARTYEYLEACERAAVYPSVMGLAVHGFGISRQALNQYLARNPETQTAEFINEVRDLMADILTNAAIYRNADSVSVIFQLKNHFDHADRVQLEPVTESPLGPAVDPDEIRRRIESNCVEE